VEVSTYNGTIRIQFSEGSKRHQCILTIMLEDGKPIVTSGRGVWPGKERLAAIDNSELQDFLDKLQASTEKTLKMADLRQILAKSEPFFQVQESRSSANRANRF